MAPNNAATQPVPQAELMSQAQPMPQVQQEEARKISYNTKRKTASDMQLIKDHLRSVGESRDVESIPLNELDVHFGNFLITARKQDKSLYGASSLHGFAFSLNRYLQDKNYPHYIGKGSGFKHTMSVLNQKKNEHKILVLKNAENNKLNLNDIERLFQMGEIGLHNPKALMQFLYISIIQGLRIGRGLEMYKLKWGDILFCVMANGIEFLTHVKYVNPTTNAESSGTFISSGAKIFANVDKDRCPIEVYKLYASKRPITMNDPSSPFLLFAPTKSPMAGQAWYASRCMGRNAIGGLMKELIRKSRLALTEQ